MIRHAFRAARWIPFVAAIPLVACQPVDDEVNLGEATAAANGGADSRVADLHGILEATDEAADEWAAGARLVELSVELDGGAPVAGRATYLGPDADRLLIVEVSDSAVEEQQPTAETLGFEPVPGVALDEVPQPPEDLLEPADIADAAGGVLDDCGVDEVRELLYATGAPAAWDGTAWVDQPGWRLTALADDGAGAVLEHDGSARPDPCIDVG